MTFRHINVASLGNSLSNVMAGPSSAERHTHEPGLEEYRRLGGNCLHLHGEGGETHSRRFAGEWLRTHGIRDDFFLCTQICHDEWDEAKGQEINRFFPAAVAEDVARDLEVLGTGHIDMVYLDDSPGLPIEPMIDAIADEIAAGRIGVFGVRNWSVERMQVACTYATSMRLPTISALVTTELSLLKPATPLWPEYLPFDDAMERFVVEQRLVVLAHVADLHLGQSLFGNEDAICRLRPEWLSRWEGASNRDRVPHILEIASKQGLSARELNVAWVLSRPFPVVGIVGLPSLLTVKGAEYERASQTVLPIDLQ